MADVYIQILQEAKTAVVWEIVLLSLFFAVLTVLVFLIPYEYRSKDGAVRGTFLRMRAKWQMWVFKGMVAVMLTAACLGIDFGKVQIVQALEADLEGQAVETYSGEYAVESELFGFGNRLSVWITEGSEARSLTLYPGNGLPNPEEIGIGTVVYAKHSQVVLEIRDSTEN